MPNGKIGASAITNVNRRGSRRFERTVGIGYNEDIGAAMAAIRKLCDAEERVLEYPAPDVWTAGPGESSVGLLVRAWAATPDLWLA